MGHRANQNFVTIPYDKFKNILKYTAVKYGIAVITREESYTSQASLADKDKIPTYGKNDKKVKFTGSRSAKAYTLDDDTIVNADINGAGNILRKQYPKLFEDLKREDLIKMMGNIKTVDMKDIYKNAKQCPGTKYKKKASLSRHMHKNMRYEKKVFYRHLFKSKALNGIEGVCPSCKVAA
jgi:putative transposase